MIEEVLVTARYNAKVDPVLGIWTWEVAVYLFLGGITAGILFFVAIVHLLGRQELRASGENSSLHHCVFCTIETEEIPLSPPVDHSAFDLGPRLTVVQSLDAKRVPAAGIGQDPTFHGGRLAEVGRRAAEAGLEAARSCCSGLAARGGCEPHQVLPFSTGVIGENLPVERLLAGLQSALDGLDEDGWPQAAEAIMTTDTRPKLVSRRVQLTGGPVTVTGIAKGAGMICPDMATMLAYLATDAGLQPALLQDCLERAVAPSFNSISVDGDTSTNDACVLLASGRGLLEQLMENLVSNAIKYTPAGRVLVGVRHAGPAARIEVIDTGPGIPEESHEKIFQEFLRLDPRANPERGLGLGLPVTILVDESGCQLGHMAGPAEWDSDDAKALIRALGLAARSLMLPAVMVSWGVASVAKAPSVRFTQITASEGTPSSTTVVTVPMSVEKLAGTRVDSSTASVKVATRRSMDPSPSLSAVVREERSGGVESALKVPLIAGLAAVAEALALPSVMVAPSVLRVSPTATVGSLVVSRKVTTSTVAELHTAEVMPAEPSNQVWAELRVSTVSMLPALIAGQRQRP